MTDDLKERLLPCPFCGGEAEFALGATGDGKDWHYVECTDCEAVGPRAQYADHRIKEALAEAWNLRAPDPRITDLEARLAESQAAEEGALMMLTQTIVERDSERAQIASLTDERDAALAEGMRIAAGLAASVEQRTHPGDRAEAVIYNIGFTDGRKAAEIAILARAAHRNRRNG